MMISRPLTDNRMQRAFGATQIETTRLDAIREILRAPTMGDLTAQVLSVPQGDFDTLPDDFDLTAFREEDRRITQEIGRLQSATFPEDEQSQVLDRIEALSEQRRQNIADMRAAVQASQDEGIASGRLLAVDELNETYRDLGVTFDFPMSRDDAEAVVKERRAEIIRDAVISRSPGGVVQGVGMFGAGLLAMATDPMEVAATFVPIVSQARMARLTTRFGLVGGRVAVGAIEGGVGQALTEPIYYGAARELQLDYGMTDALFNVGIGVAFGASVGGVLGAMARRSEVTGAAPAVRTQVLHTDAVLARTIAETSLRQFTTDQPVNLRAILEGRDLRATTTLGRAPQIEFTPKPAAPEAERVVSVDVPEVDSAGRRVGSWVLINRGTGEIRAQVHSLTDAQRASDQGFEAVPVSDYLPEYNRRVREAGGQQIDSTQVGRDLVAAAQARRATVAAEAEGVTPDALAVETPRGRATRAETPEQRMQAATQKVAMRRMQAAQLAEEARRAPHSFADDVRRIPPEREAQEADLMADLEYQRAMVDQITDLTPAERAELDELARMDERTRALTDTTQAAAACLART